MNPQMWNAFHDGEINSVSGSVPGDLELSIEAGYLMEQFADGGKRFLVRIIQCDMVSFRSFKTNQTSEGLDALAGQDLEILCARQDGDALELTTAAGVVRLRYDSETVALDTGRALQISDLAAASDRAVAGSKRP